MEKNKVIAELIYQLADDNLINAYRGSEWLGLAPHIEEDVAFSSINQDTMGHAFMYYQLLEDLNEGGVDEVSHTRSANDFRNAIIFELKNGTGSYLEKPNYNWAYTMVRQLFFGILKEIRLESLTHSSYEPLVHTARKIQTEQYYHLMHWKTWFLQLMTSTDEAREKMEKAIENVWVAFGDALSFGKYADEISHQKLILLENQLEAEWMERINTLFKQCHYTISGKPEMKHGNGRDGEYTEDLVEALDILGEVYNADKQAVGW